MTSTPRDYAAEYLAARTDARRPGADLTARNAAEKAARRIDAAAIRAGITLDVGALDEAARTALYPTA